MKKGIDISYCQKGLDLQAAKKEGVEFVIIRAGAAASTDSQLRNHMEGAAKAGLPYGFYWYSMAFTVEQAEKEAEACLSAISRYAPAYPVYYDMEEKGQIDKLDKATRTAIITTFCDTIKAAGYTPGIYLNPSWLENYVDKQALLDKYDLWLACWTENPDVQPKYQYGQKVWQWGLDKVGGMNVDGDVCFYDYEQTEKTSVSTPVVSDIKTIYKSLAVVNRRKKADIRGETSGTCVKDGYFAASQLVTPATGAQQWFRHAGTDLYSALTDTPVGGNAKLFEQYGTYTTGKTTDCVNVRTEAGTNKHIITSLPTGADVYLTGKTALADGMTWAQVVYGGKLAWMAKQYISC